MTSQMILGLALVLPSYFLWTVIHEVSHIVAARLTTGITWWSLKPWPQIYEGSLWWGASEWKWARLPTPRESAIVSLAPRVPDIVASLVFPWGILLSGYGFVIWVVLWGGGLVDLITGSIGYSEHSDLKKACRVLDKDPSVVRLVGFAIVLSSITPLIASWSVMGW